MNRVIYSLLKKADYSWKCDEDYFNNLYVFYKMECMELNCCVNVTEEEFKKIIFQIYDVLRFRITEVEFRNLIEHYLSLVISDALVGREVDVDWCICHIWYLCVGVSQNIIVDDYKDCILLIQQNLIREFQIKEKFSKKVRRKIMIMNMI